MINPGFQNVCILVFWKR